MILKFTRSISSTKREISAPLYTVLAVPHLKYYMQFWLVVLKKKKKDLKLEGRRKLNVLSARMGILSFQGLIRGKDIFKCNHKNPWCREETNMTASDYILFLALRKH